MNGSPKHPLYVPSDRNPVRWYPNRPGATHA